MVGGDDEIGAHAEGLDPAHQIADPRIDLCNRGVELGRAARAEPVPGGVDGIEIHGDEARTDRSRSAHPVEHGVHALRIADILVEAQPVARTAAVMRNLAAWPEHRRSAHARLFGGDPDRLGLSPPERIERLARIAHAERLVGADGVDHHVTDNAVAVGALAGDDGIMVGKGLAGEARPHRRRDAALAEFGEIGRQPALEIVGTHPVDRDQDRDRRVGILGLGRGRGRQRQREQRCDQPRDHADSPVIRAPGVPCATSAVARRLMLFCRTDTLSTTWKWLSQASGVTSQTT